MSSLDAKQRVAVFPLCGCSPEPHEPLSSDRVVLGKMLLLHSLGWDMAVRTYPQEQWRLPGTSCTTWSASWSCASAQRKFPG